MSATPAPHARTGRPVALSTGIVVFDDAEELDFIGPWEVFQVTNRLFPGSFPTALLSAGQDRFRTRYGLHLEASGSVYEAAPMQLLVLPGGPGRSAAMKDSRLLDFLRRSHDRGVLLASVCTGAFILAEAGLLRGKTATTHWSALDELRAYPDVVVVQRRFVDDGDIVTSAGISAGIDMALHLVFRFLGREASERVAQRMEYPTVSSPPAKDARGD